MQVEGVLIRWTWRAQRTVDNAALQLAKHAEALSEPQIGSEQIPLQSVVVYRRRPRGSLPDAETFRPKAELTAQRQRPILATERDVLDRIPEVDLRRGLQERPILVGRVGSIHARLAFLCACGH